MHQENNLTGPRQSRSIRYFYLAASIGLLALCFIFVALPVAADLDQPPGPAQAQISGSEPLAPAAPGLDVKKTLVDSEIDDVWPNYLTFTIEISNTGTTTVAVLPLLDEYDPYYLSLVSVSLAATNVDAVNGVASWQDLTLAPPNGFGTDLVPSDTFAITAVFTLVHDIITLTTNTASVTQARDEAGANVPPVTSTAPIVGLPTSVGLLSFHARQVPGGVRTEWSTAWEKDNWGFNLYRGLSPRFQEAEWIHFEPGQGRGEFGGQSYAYLDVDVPQGQAAYYWLEDVDLNNDPVALWMRGPVFAVSGPYRIYLPMVQKLADPGDQGLGSEPVWQ
jgi:hypothetical protein